MLARSLAATELRSRGSIRKKIEKTPLDKDARGTSPMLLGAEYISLPEWNGLPGPDVAFMHVALAVNI